MKAFVVGLWMAAAAVSAQQAPVPVNRAARDTWTPVMEVLRSARNVTITDAQLQRLRELPLEAVWGALQGRRYVRTFEGGFQQTVPGAKIVGRAVTMRYLPVRPDLMEAVQTLAKHFALRVGFGQGLGEHCGEKDRDCGAGNRGVKE